MAFFTLVVFVAHAAFTFVDDGLLLLFDFASALATFFHSACLKRFGRCHKDRLQ